MKKTKWNQQSFFAMIKGNEKQNYCLNIKLVVFGRIQIITTNNQRAIFEWRKKNQGESLSQLFSSFSFHSFLAGWLTVMAYCHTLSLSLSFFFLFPISFNRIVVVEQTIKKSQVKRNFCQSSTHYENFFFTIHTGWTHQSFQSQQKWPNWKKKKIRKNLFIQQNDGYYFRCLVGTFWAIFHFI